MKLSRTVRRWAAGIAMASVAFAQLAVAAYACPVDQPPAATHAAGCEGMAPEAQAPNLCQAHCQQGDQSLDKPQAEVAAPVDVLLPASFSPPAANDTASPRAPAPAARAAPPPLLQLHARLRI